jgi:small subunit ribosomal protein S15
LLAKLAKNDRLAALSLQQNCQVGSHNHPKMSQFTTDTKAFQLHDKDTGSADVQVVRLTDRINHLTAHLSNFSTDHSTRRGLLKMVSLRRKLLDYIRANSEERYKNLIASLKLRR